MNNGRLPAADRLTPPAGTRRAPLEPIAGRGEQESA
jgi:hypothetical protein